MNPQPDNKGYIATIGNFDGVHLGHRHVLAALRCRAEQMGLRPLVVTFANHPLTVVAPERAPQGLLSPAHEKGEKLSAQGVEVCQLTFSPELRSLTAREFMTLLRDTYGVKAILMGFNNKIGHDRHLTPDDYTRIAREEGMAMVFGDEWGGEGHGEGVNSSHIRKLLRAGRIEDANALLGYDYTLEGVIGHGKEIGRTIGFPTANLSRISPHKLIPAPGVYAAWADVPHCESSPAMVNVGHRPTVDAEGAPLTVEVHLIDFSGDLYGSSMSVRLVKRLRDELRFPSLEALRAQLALDRDNALQALNRPTHTTK